MKPQHPDSNLAALWQDILAERQSKEATQWRKLEAKAGYDPGEAPDALIEGLQRYSSLFGQASVEELSSENRAESVLDLADTLKHSLQNANNGT